MLGSIHDYFLSGFENEPFFEKKKARLLLNILLTVTAVVVVVTISQNVLSFGNIYTIGNAVALLSLMGAFFLFKYKRVQDAGHLMICGVIVMAVIHNVYHDLFSDPDPAMRYRIYIDMTALMGIYFSSVAFFRERKQIIYYAFTFEIILATHSLILYYKLNQYPGLGMFVIEHFATVFIGVISIAVFNSWLVSYIDTLIEQNGEYSKFIQSQNEHLEGLVDDRTKALSRSNESLREFAHVVSHDLKEPLRTISGFVTLMNKELTKQGLMQNSIEEYATFVKMGTQQMERLISDILAYSKLNVEDQQFEDVNIQEVFTEVKRTLAKSIYESEAQINFINSVDVKGERRLLAQLFQNLISNAIKYRSELREPIINIGCTDAGNMVCYYIADNGIGIEEKHYDTIFEAFKRLHSKAEYEGTGVGLATCKKIVDIHEGRIWVESAEGQGSTFYFTLPKSHIDVPAMYPVVHAD